MKEKDVSKKCLKTWRAMVEIWKHLRVAGPSGIGVNQNLKDLARKINIRNGNLKNSCLYCSNSKTCKAYDFPIDSEYSMQDVTIFDDIDATSFDFYF